MKIIKYYTVSIYNCDEKNEQRNNINIELSSNFASKIKEILFVLK